MDFLDNSPLDNENVLSESFNYSLSGNSSAKFLQLDKDLNDSYIDYNNTFLEEEIHHEFQITLRNYLYQLYKKRKSEELYDVPWTLVIILSILYGSLSVISLFGNGLVIWVIMTSRKMRTVTSMYIVNLAIADVIIGLFAIPFQFQAALLQRWHLPDFMCAFCPFFQVLSVNLSVFTLSAIALDRYSAVMHPLKARTTKKQAALAITCVWLISVLLALPSYLDYKVVTARKVFMPPHPYCRNVWLSPGLRKVYNIGLVATQYFLPLFIISVSYLRMGFRLWGRTAPGNKEEGRDAVMLRNKKRAIKMLALVVLLFGVCWLPLQLYNFVQYIYPKINNYQYINVVWFSIHWLAMSNSCVNPFIYAIYNDNFQDEFATRLGCLGKCCRIFRRKPALQYSSTRCITNDGLRESGGRRNFRSSGRIQNGSFTASTTVSSIIKKESDKRRKLSYSAVIRSKRGSNIHEHTFHEQTEMSICGSANIFKSGKPFKESEKTRKTQGQQVTASSQYQSQCHVVNENSREVGATKTVTALIITSSNIL